MLEAKPAQGRILLADDDVDVRRPIGKILEQAGYEVTIVATGAEAADALTENDYDLLITDINMPGNRELELLHSRDPETAVVPIIIITGYPTVPTAIEALRMAAVDYIVKPLEIDDLLQRVAKGVDKGRALRAVRHAKADASSLARWLKSMETALDSAGPRQEWNGDGTDASAPLQDEDVLSRLAPGEYQSLSPRERDVLREIALGRRVGDIAGQLHISPHTVRNHLKSIFRKLGVNSQVGLLGKLTRG